MTWQDFWKNQSVFSDDNFSHYAQRFAPVALPVLGLTNSDVVLDIGCGPGFILKTIRPNVRAVVGVDISPNYIEKCRRLFSGDPNAEFRLLGENYTDLSALAGRSFSLILCMSVFQYYRDIGEVEILLRNLKKLSTPESRILIGDLAVTKDSLGDLLGVLRAAWNERYFLPTLFVTLKALTSRYRLIRKQVGLLSFAPEELEALLSRHLTQWSYLDLPLTTNLSRKHIWGLISPES